MKKKSQRWICWGSLPSCQQGRKEFPYTGIKKITGRADLVHEMSSLILEKLNLRNLMYM